MHIILIIAINRRTHPKIEWFHVGVRCALICDMLIAYQSIKFSPGKARIWKSTPAMLMLEQWKMLLRINSSSWCEIERAHYLHGCHLLNINGCYAPFLSLCVCRVLFKFKFDSVLSLASQKNHFKLYTNVCMGLLL